jgi:hypothetical protein
MGITKDHLNKLFRTLFFIFGALGTGWITYHALLIFFIYFDPCSTFPGSYSISANYPWLNATKVATLQKVLNTLECSKWLANHPLDSMLSWFGAFFTLITAGVGGGRVWVSIYDVLFGR